MLFTRFTQPVRFKSFIALFLMLFSFASNADFTDTGKGKLLFPTGTEKDLEFILAATKLSDGYSFQAGQQQLEVSQIPEKYSIWLSMNKEELIYVQEFATTYFKEFELELGEHSIMLKKKILSPKRAKGDYVLSIDNIDYFFTSTQGQIDIYLGEDGITEIDASGFAKDLGMSE